MLWCGFFAVCAVKEPLVFEFRLHRRYNESMNVKVCSRMMLVLSLALGGCGGAGAAPPAGTPGATAPPPATFTPAVTPSPTLAVAPPTPTATPIPTPPGPLTHTVQSGDTLLGLALSYGVPVAALQIANDLGESTLIYPGQVLTIPDATAWRGAAVYWMVHTVRAGETLGALAAAYGVTLDELMRVNGLSNADFISVGEDLIVPVAAPAEARHAPSSAGTGSSAPLPTPAERPPFIPLPDDPPPADVQAWPAEVLRLINYARAAYGLHPLTWHPILAQVAQTQADECAATGVCEHVNAAGLHYRDRMRLAGYVPLYGSECIGRRNTPREIVYSWLNETPPNDAHRRTILGKNYIHAGVGMAASRSTYYYFVVDFGRPAP